MWWEVAHELIVFVMEDGCDLLALLHRLGEAVGHVWPIALG